MLPVVTIPLSFLDLTLQTFTPDLEQALVDSVQSSLSRAANVNISLANIAAGSVNLVVETIFLDANQEAAAQLLNNAQLLASVSVYPAVLCSCHCWTCLNALAAPELTAGCCKNLSLPCYPFHKPELPKGSAQGQIHPEVLCGFLSSI